MKRIVSLLLILVCVLAGCANKSTDSSWKTDKDGLKSPKNIDAQLTEHATVTSLSTLENGYSYSGENWSVYALRSTLKFADAQYADYEALALETSTSLKNTTVSEFKDDTHQVILVESDSSRTLYSTTATDTGTIGYTITATSSVLEELAVALDISMDNMEQVWAYTGPEGIQQASDLTEGWGYRDAYRGVYPWPLSPDTEGDSYWAMETGNGYFVFAIGDEVKPEGNSSSELAELVSTYTDNDLTGAVWYLETDRYQAIMYSVSGTYFISIARYDTNGNIQLTGSDMHDLSIADQFYAVYGLDDILSQLKDSKPYWSNLN